jgi:hypothetical protein
MMELNQSHFKKPGTFMLHRGEVYLVTGTIKLPAGTTEFTVGGTGTRPKIVSRMGSKAAAFHLGKGVALLSQSTVEWDLTKGGVGLDFDGGSAWLLNPVVGGGHFINAREWDVIEVRDAMQTSPLRKYFAFFGDLYTKPIAGCARRALLRDCEMHLGSAGEALVRSMRGHFAIWGGRYISGAPGKQTVQGRGELIHIRGNAYIDGSIEIGPLTKSATNDHLTPGLRTKALIAGARLVGEIKAKPGSEVVIDGLKIEGRDPRGGGSNSAIIAENTKHLDRQPAVVYVCNSSIANAKDDRELATPACHLGNGNKRHGQTIKPDGNWNEPAVNQIRKAVAS